jgi:type III secretion protein Q
MQTDAADTISYSERPIGTNTVELKPMKRLGARRMTRAHLAISERPEVSAQATEALASIRDSLEKQLASPIGMQPRLLEAAVSPFGALSRNSAFALFELAPAGAKAVLEIDLPLLCGLLERVSGGGGPLSAASRLTRIEEAAFGYLCLVAVSAARGQAQFQRRFGPRLLSVHRDRGDLLERLDCTLRYLGLEITVTVGAATGTARVLLPAVCLQALVQDAAVERSQQIAPEVLAARLETRCFLGKVRLDSGCLRGLEVGDVIVFDEVALKAGALAGSCRLVTRTFELRGELGPEGFLFSRANNRAHPQERTMKSPPDETNALPIEVEIELTRIRLSLAELALLKPGALLPLHMNAAQPVLLRIGERAVARAELVELEGEVGARITSLLP